MNTRKIRILVADDHTIVRMGIVSLLETEGDFQIVGEARDGAEAVRLCQKLRPDVILIDLMMPVLDGSAAIAEIARSVPEAKSLVLTTSAASDEILQALDNGAVGAISKNAPFDELADAIRRVFAGERTVSPEIQGILGSDSPVTRLSARQAEILDLIAKGLTNPDIARLLGISVYMVKEHVNALFVKIDASNRAEAVAIAHRRHLLKI